MLKSWVGWCCQLGVSSLLVIVGLSSGSGSTFAQVTADPSLGTLVTKDGNTLKITEGTTVSGKNVFHSFSNFSVGNNEVVNFLNNPGVDNILVRVTGGNSSLIQGRITAQGKANLFFINPNGIVFSGRNAKIEIGGSFIGTTANAIQFPGGGEFSINSPVNPLDPLLKVNPSALLFNQIASNNSIQVNRASLFVEEAQSLLLVGGDVKLEQAQLQAQSGRVELGGLAGVGTVGLNMDSSGSRLSFPQGVPLADVFLSKSSSIDADGDGRGGIQVQGRQIRLTENSDISINNVFGAQPGGTLALTASELVELSGTSRLLTDTEGTGGNAGSIRIDARQLIVQSGAQVSASTSSNGQGGTLSVTTESIQLIGTSGTQPSGLFTATRGTGSAGSLEIKTGQLIVGDGARISASTSLESRGQGGSIIVDTRELDVRDGAVVTVNSAGLGNAGSLTVNGNTIKLDQGKLTGTTASGNGGDINLQVQDLILLRNGSAIATTAANNGSGGNITINSQFVVANQTENNDILANANLGPGGKIKIDATGIYGLENRTNLPEDQNISEINASSEFNQDGIIEINTPDVDPVQGLLELPTNLVDASQQITQGCTPRGGQTSSFTATGRGGLPLSPNEPLRQRAVITQWVTLDEQTGQKDAQVKPVGSSQHSASEKPPIVEANGWVVDDLGNIYLVASAPNTIPPGQNIPSASCTTS